MKKSIVTVGILLSTAGCISAQERKASGTAKDQDTIQGNPNNRTKDIEEVVVVAY